jgi:hypothetical protein
MKNSNRHTWVPAVAALSGAAFVLDTALVVGFHDRIADGPLFVMYDVAILLGAAAGVGLGLRRDHVAARVAVAVLAPLLLVAWILGLGEVLEPAVGLFSDKGYVKDEIPVGVLGLVLLAAAYVGYRHDQQTGAPSYAGAGSARA